jgi:hypothetical protein
MRGAVSTGESLARLHELIAGERGELASSLVPFSAVQEEGSPSGREAFGPLVVACERGRRDAREYGLLVESICEGYLLHYWQGRLLQPKDADLRLLAGDFLYAFGLSRLAALGDLDAVSELADLIALCARVHSLSTTRENAASLAAGAWCVCTLGVGGGPWREGEDVKARLRKVPRDGDEALEAAARRARELGTSIEVEQALIAFTEIVSRDAGST